MWRNLNTGRGMEDFLKNMMEGIEDILKKCASENFSANDLKKPFDKVYDEVRQNPEGIISFEEYKIKKREALKKLKHIYVNGEKSIYTEVIKEFLKQHPELGKDYKEK